jgi:cobalt-zinc-cadmium efflux system membrane fusion protein
MNRRAKCIVAGLLGIVALTLAITWIIPRGNGQTAGLAQAAGKPEGQKDNAKEPAGGKEKGHAKAKPDTGNKGDSDHEGVVKLSEEEMREYGVKVLVAGPGEIKVSLRLNGEVQFDPDLVVRVRAQAPGVVREVRKKVGDTVRQGEVLAVLESRELAEANAKLASNKGKEALARAAFQREEQLWKEKITSEREYLEARQALEEAVIERQLAQRRLTTFGSATAGLAEAEAGIARYELKAPMSGTIIERNLVRGEFIKEEAERPPLIIADTGRVWVNLAVYQKDLARVVPGNKALVIFGHGIDPAEGVVDYVSPAVGEGTRTATARVILNNPGNRYRPGLFVSAEVVVDKEMAEVAVPKSALQTFEGGQVVWIQEEEGFRPTTVEVGRANGESAEVVSGLAPGQRYVAEGAFTLKAELGKEAFGEGHGH